MNNASTTDAARSYWTNQGHRARQLGVKRDQSQHLPCHQVCIDCWLTAWDREDKALASSVAYQRTLKAISHVERKKARELASTVRGLVERALFPSTNAYATAKNGEPTYDAHAQGIYLDDNR